jgi:hypothetical protein
MADKKLLTLYPHDVIDPPPAQENLRGIRMAGARGQGRRNSTGGSTEKEERKVRSMGLRQHAMDSLPLYIYDPPPPYMRIRNTRVTRS